MSSGRPHSLNTVMGQLVCAVALLAVTPAVQAITMIGNFNPGIGNVQGIAYHAGSGDLFLYHDSSLIRVYTQGGSFVRSFNRAGTNGDDWGLDFTFSPINIDGTVVPADTLLLSSGEEPTYATVFAQNPANGALLDSVQITSIQKQLTGGTHHATRGTLFVINWNTDLVYEVNASSGAVLNSFAGISFNHGGIDVVQATGNLLMVSDQHSTIREMTPTGATVQEINSLGISSMAGIAMDDRNGEAWISTTNGAVYHVGGLPAFIPEEACCLPNGSCAEQSATDCTNAGGTPHGSGTTCAGFADADSDGSPDICDLCPGDSAKIAPGVCGCGVADADADSDGTLDCNDDCDNDPNKIAPGICGCGEIDLDCNSNGVCDSDDAAGSTSDDVNTNTIPDECEVSRWIGADGTPFTQPANWDPAGVPTVFAELSNTTGSDNRCILNAAGETALLSIAIEATGSGQQILRIDAGSTLVPELGTTIHPGGRVDLRGGELAGGLVTNQANTISGYGVISAPLLNQGLTEATPGAGGHILTFAGSSMENASGALLRGRAGSLVLVESNDVSQAGEIECRTTATIVFSTPLVNSADGVIRLLGGSLVADSLLNVPGADITGTGTLDGTVMNEGRMTLIANTLIVGDLVNDGTITIQNGVLTVTGNVSGSGVIIGGFGG